MTWSALDAQTGLPLPEALFPKAALRNAFGHKFERVDVRVGVVFQEIFHDYRTSESILVEYVCIEGLQGQGTGAGFKKYYYSRNKEVQWVHFIKQDGRWEATTNEFSVFPN